MCFDELIGTLAANVTRICCVRHNPDESKISYAFIDEPKLQHAVFVDANESKNTWDAAVILMTRMCKPACIEAGAHLLFQPAFAISLRRHADERGYFVVVGFQGRHDIALGSLTMAEREERYKLFCQLFALDPADGEQAPVIQ